MIDFLKGTVTPKDWMAVAGIAGILLVICALFVFGVHNKQVEALNGFLAEDKVVQKDLSQAQAIEANIEALRAETAKIENLVSDFEERLPNTREIPTLVKQFEALADDIDVKVQLATLSRTRDGNKETIPYSVVAEGDFHQIVRFINRLERFERYLKISDLEIGEEKQGVCKAEFTLSTYRFLETKTGNTP